MYQLARAGIPIEPKAVEVVIRNIELLNIETNKATIDVEVESGTYVRSLAHDLGLRLGCGAHLEELRRTHVGPLDVEQAISLEELESCAQEGNLRQKLMTPARALSELPGIRVEAGEKLKICHGRPISTEAAALNLSHLREEQPVRLLDSEDELVAIGAMASDRETIRPIVVLRSESSHGSTKTSSGRPLQVKTRVV
jgi:tRNA pseudouridine55 synthase